MTGKFWTGCGGSSRYGQPAVGPRITLVTLILIFFGFELADVPLRTQPPFLLRGRQERSEPEYRGQEARLHLLASPCGGRA